MALYAGDNVEFELDAQDERGSVLPITGFSVKWRYTIQDQAKTVVKSGEKVATITDGPAGKAVYKTASADLVPGQLTWEWEITDGGGGKLTGPDRRRVQTVLAKLTVS